MISLNLQDINVIRMLTNPPKVLVNVGMRLINLSDNFIYEWSDMEITWIKIREAERNDFNAYPQLLN